MKWKRDNNGRYTPEGNQEYRIVRDTDDPDCWYVTRRKPTTYQHGPYLWENVCSVDLLRDAKAHVEMLIEADGTRFKNAVLEQAENWMDEGLRHGALDLGFAAGIILDELEKHGKLYTFMDREEFASRITRAIVEDAKTVASAFFEDVDEAMKNA